MTSDEADSVPLLRTQLQADTDIVPTPAEKARRDAIPWKAIIPLMLYRMTEAIGYFLVFPFITAMITSFGTEPGRIGLYAGLAEGAMMVVEAIFAPAWARLADRYGSRPLIILGTLGCIFPACMVGFSTKVWYIILWRGLLGCSPVALLGKTMIAQACNIHNRARVFALYSPSFALGGMISTLLGGELTHPYGRLPRWLGGSSDFLHRWPYALPCMVTAVLYVGCTIMELLCLKPTASSPGAIKLDDEEDQKVKRPEGSRLREALRVPNFFLLTVVFCMFQILSMSFSAIYSVYAYTPVSSGGLGLPVDIIGLITSASELSFIILTPFALPWLLNELGNARSQQVILIVWPFLALSFPLAQHLAATSSGWMSVVIFWQQVGETVGNFSWPLCDMLTMAAFDEYPHLLASGSAIVLIAGAGGRAIGPVLAGWLYSASTQFEAGSWGRQYYWIAFLACSIPPLILAFYLRDNKAAEKKGYEAVPLTPSSFASTDDDE